MQGRILSTLDILTAIAALAALWLLAGSCDAAEPVWLVTVQWHTGPTLTRQAEPVVDRWYVVGPIGCQSLAAFLERQIDDRKAAGHKLAWNLTGQVDQLANQIRTKHPGGDFIGQWIPSESDWLTITDVRLDAALSFRSGKERFPIRLSIDRYDAVRLEPDITPVE